MAAANCLLDHLCANASSDVAPYLTLLHFFRFWTLVGLDIKDVQEERVEMQFI